MKFSKFTRKFAINLLVVLVGILAVATVTYAAKYIRYTGGQFEITGTDNLKVAGSLGLGIVGTPVYKLDIRDASSAGGTAIISLNQDNAATLFTGLRLARQGSEKWFAGMDENNDKFRVYHAGDFEHNFDLTIDTAGKVGIGTLSPTQKLDVSGTAQMTGFKMPTDASAGYVLTSDASGVGTWQAATGGGTIGGSGTADYLSKWTNSSTLGNSVIYDDGTNVGIGTASPIRKMEVHSDDDSMDGASFINDNTGTNAHERLWVYTNGGGDPYQTFGIYNGGTPKYWSVGLDNSDGDKFKIEPESSVGIGTTSLTIDTSGKVGIGTAAPGYKLSVVDAGIVPIVNIWNNSATSYYTGMRLARAGSVDGTEKWFLGMSATDDKLRFRRADSTDDMTIDTSGNVAIINGNLDLGNHNITGVNKISVNTIDPVYEINGKNYATYVSDTAGGVKTETFGKIEVKTPADGGYEAVLNLSRQPEGSDLWLFSKTSDYGKNMDSLVVILTPEGKGDISASYELIPLTDTLIVHTPKPAKVSYHLVAPRLDHEQWGNVAEEGETAGFVVKE